MSLSTFNTSVDLLTCSVLVAGSIHKQSQSGIANVSSPGGELDGWKGVLSSAYVNITDVIALVCMCMLASKPDCCEVEWGGVITYLGC